MGSVACAISATDFKPLETRAVVYLRSAKKIAEKSAQGARDGSLVPIANRLKFIQKKVVSPETTG
jgi:hypothetical protein